MWGENVSSRRYETIYNTYQSIVQSILLKKYSAMNLEKVSDLAI
jgi:hypothetical protein